MGKGRVLRGVRTALWKRSRPPQAWQIGCGQGGSSISGTVSGFQLRMAEVLLDHPEVDPGLEQMGGI